MKSMTRFYWIVLAGLAGGLAEVVWIGVYGLFGDVSLSTVGHAIAATVFSGDRDWLLVPMSGFVIHMMLSVFLALGFGYALWPWVERFLPRRQVALMASMITLVVVWKINFFVLLPVWNPGFVAMLPLGVSLVSKILFGVAMGSVLSRHKPALA